MFPRLGAATGGFDCQPRNARFTVAEDAGRGDSGLKISAIRGMSNAIFGYQDTRDDSWASIAYNVQLGAPPSAKVPVRLDEPSAEAMKK